MILIRGRRGRERARGSVLTLGNFDGVHLGHRRVLKDVVKRARALSSPSVVYTFEPHPMKVVSPQRSPKLLADNEDKFRLIEGLGLDCLISARFTKGFASRHPREFVVKELVSDLSVKEVWVGHDFAFGRGKSGTPEYLKTLGREFGFKVRVIGAYRVGASIVSSSRIRALVSEGSVKEAGRALGRPYSIKGIVVKGSAIGGAIGFPTANLSVKSELLPKDGVYAGYAVIGRDMLPTVVNIGFAPTFKGKRRKVEAHIIGFNKDIYRKRMRVFFIQRLRDEMGFRDKALLVGQIRKDITRALKVLGRDKPSKVRPWI